MGHSEGGGDLVWNLPCLYVVYRLMGVVKPHTILESRPKGKKLENRKPDQIF